MAREFTDPITGRTLDDPTPKSYDVTFSVKGGNRQNAVIDTLSEKRLTKAEAKKRIVKMPRVTGQFMAPVSTGNVTIHSISKR